MAQCATVEIKVGSQSWFMSLFYASFIPSLHYQLWDRLTSIKTMVNGPWMLTGDFNEVLLPSESVGDFFRMLKQGSFVKFYLLVISPTWKQKALSLLGTITFRK
jgi:hypothetical protein